MAETDLTVVILEDHDFQRSLAKRMLERAGAAMVLEAANGHHALEVIAAAATRVDIVVCDLDMPGMDGIEFIRHLAEHQLAEAVIIASSMEAAVLSSVESMTMALGVTILGTIKKPITAAQLNQLLGAYQRKSAPTFTLPASRHQVTIPDIKRALLAEELVPFFQPKVHLRTGEVTNAEALVRWRHPQEGLIPPGAFIPLVETSKGLMDDLTTYMIRRSVQQVRDWNQAGARITVGVNVSVVNMMDVRMADTIVAIVQEYGVDPEQITIELTESAVTENIARLIEGLARLRMRRFGLSIDDFGTGYSSLQQLSRIPFTELKIDTSFVRGVSRNPRARAVLETAVDLARRLELHTVAEGVEEREDWDLLTELGVDYAQGYFAARPLPAEEFVTWRQTWRPPV